MKFDPHSLGLYLLASGMPLMQFGGSKAAWWIGLAMMTAGPILASLRKKGTK